MQQHSTSIVTPPTTTLDGRVFVRQQLFASLPASLQEDTKQFCAFVGQDTSRLFQMHHHALVKSVYSVKGKDLIDVIISWLQARNIPTVRKAVGRNSQARKAHGHMSPAQIDLTLASAATDVGQTWEAPIEEDLFEAPASPKQSLDVTEEQLKLYAAQIAEALVLSGFVTPYKDDHTLLSLVAPEQRVYDRTMLVPVAPNVTDLTTTSVWSVADGAVYARALKRKAGVLGHFATTGRNVYVIMNGKTKKLYLFESDLARDLISELSGETLRVEIDTQQFDFGVRVSSSTSPSLGEDQSEYFNVETLDRQEEFVRACVSIGAIYDDDGIKRTIDTDGIDLVEHDAVLGYPTTHLKMTEEDPVAELTVTSLSGPRPASHSKSSRSLIAADEQAAMKRQKHSVVSQPTLTESQKQHGGSYSTLVDQLHDHALVSFVKASVVNTPAVTQYHDQNIMSSHAGAPATDVPTLTEHSENGMTVHPAPPFAS